MRALCLTLALAVFWCSGARAECLEAGLVTFPAPGSVIPLNGKLLLEGVGPDAAKVGLLVGQRLILRAKEDAVSVTVRRGWSSRMNRQTVVLVPNATLRPNLRYQLELPASLSRAQVHNGASLVWISGERSDTRAPRWEQRPSVTEAEYKLEDGRPARSIHLHMKLEDESPAYLVVTLKRARGDASSQTYFAPVESGELSLGHDSCSGRFTFDDGRAYFATLHAYDTAGNAAPALPPLELHAPRKEITQ